ncbi:Retrovirus-related Pol poly from transposon, partial [Paramuricea clavata]
LIGSKTYSLLKDLLLPEKPADKNFDEIVSTLQKHLNPKPLEIAERFRFYKRNQQEGESILSYIAELKKLTTHCNFGNNLEETLRDRLVCGLSNQQIQKRLLAESKLKFSKAVDIAVAMETATRDATEIHSKGREEKPLVCYRCGANTHVATECRFKKEVCHKCGKRGHIQRACRAQQSQGPGRPSPRSRYQKSTNAIETEPDEYEHLLNNLEVHNVNKSNSDVIWVDVKVENQPLSMELDTGSAVSILPYDMFLERFRDKKLEKTTTVLKTYTGELIVPSRLRVQYSSHRNPGTTTQEKLKNLLDTYAEVFEDKLGTFKSAKARITLKEGSQPQFRKARQVPYSLRPKVEEELKRLQSEGILSKVEWSDWATPIVPLSVAEELERNFTLLTDHEPLTSIFHPSKSLPVVTAARLQRYALFLAGFDYTIRYKNTKLHGNADGLSRLPLHSETTEEEPDPVGLFYATQFEPLPVTAEQVKRETQRDPLLAKRKDELTVHCGVLMLGHRAVIPAKLRNQVLTELHEGHLGIVKMKSLARSYIWWPKIDKDIEHLAKSCPGCQLQQNEAGKVPLHPWEWPTTPWQRIHLDFAGPFLGRMFLIIVDAHSKPLRTRLDLVKPDLQRKLRASSVKRFNPLAVSVAALLPCGIDALPTYSQQTFRRRGPTLLSDRNAKVYKKLQNIPSPQHTAQKILSNSIGFHPGRVGKRGIAVEDIVIVMDGSRSVGQCGFNEGLKALTQVIGMWEANGKRRYYTSCRYAAVTFSSEARVNFKFLPSAQASQKMSAITYPSNSGGRNTQAGLAEAEKLFLSGGRRFSKLKVLLMTDGQSNIDKSLTIPNAKKLKDMGAEIFVVAVGDHMYGIDEMAKVASYPPEKYIYRVKTNSGLLYVFELALEKVRSGYKAKPYASPCR